MLDAAGSEEPAIATSEAPLSLLSHAILLEDQGAHVAARALMHKVTALVPDWDEPWLRIAQSWRGEGRRAEAIAAYDAALMRNPNRFETLLARGVLDLAEAPQNAVMLLQRAAELAPDQHQIWHALGYGLTVLDQGAAAARAVAMAGRLEPNCSLYARDFLDVMERFGLDGLVEPPEWSDGVRLAMDGRAAKLRGALDEAADLLEAAIILLPDDAIVMKDLAAVYLSTMRPELAEPLLREAHRLLPDDTITINDLAVTLGRLYRFGEAELVMSKIRDEHDLSPQMLFNRGTLRASIGDFEGSRRDIDAAKAATTDLCLALQSECALLPYRSNTTAAMLRDAMAALGNVLPHDESPLMRPRHITADDRDRKLRIGLLSNALRQHPVGWLTFAGFKALDKAAFSLHCFGHYEPNDSFAPDFARHVTTWHDIDAMTDREAAIHIASQNVDILIDLSGIGDGGRTPIMAYRPAPVQIKWVGSQAATSGVPTMDWLITDRWETPDGYDRFYTEKLLRLPDGYVCYTPPPSAAEVNAPPALTNGYVTFGCLNNLAKLTDDSLRLWARLLERLPDARLTLRCPQFSEPNVLERFIARADGLGLASARLNLQGRAPHPMFIAAYRDIDIALDPYPYSGGLTTCEALFMGVPVITLAGDFFAARHSVSHLSNAGVEGCIATTPDEYIERAVAMAADLPALADLRARLRPQVLQSPLCDAPRFGKHLGAALRFAWHEYCASMLAAAA
ncbi:tetratricopeptide repeat protein [Acidiphilium sp.]|uniref:tetratricopeptide repeat protein n=1 Tax=Acidiphilium sp. TaxID=527 RepID=UPI003CFD800D